MSTIRWTASERPDTGVTNGTLGLWLFLAAEVMFFGSLLSSYVLLRLGNGALWASEGLDPGALSGAWKAAVLLASSVMLQIAGRRVSGGRSAGLLFAATFFLGGVFLGSRARELVALSAAGLLPKSGVATAMFYTVSGLHALHLLAVAVVLAVLLLRAPASGSGPDPRRLRQVTIAWHFFVAVWMVFFVLFHLS